MNNVIQTIAAAEAEEREVARKRYVDLLQHPDPQPAVAAELRTLMRTLGKGAAELHADHGIVQEAIAEEKRIAAAFEAQAKVDPARAEVAAHRAKMERVQDELVKENNRLVAIQGGFEGRAWAGREAFFRLETLLAHHPDLLKDRPRQRNPH